MNTLSRLLILGLVLLHATACSTAPTATPKFASRQEWHDYVDALSIPQPMREAIKEGTAGVCGLYINHVGEYLQVKGDPMKTLAKRYYDYSKVDPTIEGAIDIRDAVAKAVADLIAAGDKKAMFAGRSNSRYLDEERNGDAAWPTGTESIGSQRAKVLRGDYKRATMSQIDPGK